MKNWLITIGIVILAAVVGYVSFEVIDQDQEGDATEMIATLVTSVVVAAILGVGVVVFVLPYVAGAIANVVYDQTPQEYVAPTHLDAGRSKKMQGEYEEAIEAFRLAIEEDEPDRLAWVEIAQIQHEELEDPEAALATLKEGAEAHEWGMEDSVNFRFRMAKLQLDEMGRRDLAVELYKSVLEDFPEHDYYTSQARGELQNIGVVV